MTSKCEHRNLSEYDGGWKCWDCNTIWDTWDQAVRAVLEKHHYTYRSITHGGIHKLEDCKDGYP